MSGRDARAPSKMSSIHCPSCGREATTDQQFCRQCGMSLGTVSKLVAAHSGVETVQVQDQVSPSREEAEKKIGRRMFSWMTWGMIVAAMGIVMLVLTKSFNPGEWFKLCASFLLLAGTGIAVAGFFRAIKEGSELSSKKSQKVITTAETTKYLPEERAGVPMTSITERTTQLITSKENQNNKES